MYRKLFTEVKKFVTEIGVEVFEFNNGDPYDQDLINEIQILNDIRFPIELIEYWQEMGFNSGIRWAEKENEDNSSFCNFLVEGPNEIIKKYNWRNEFHNELMVGDGINIHENKIKAIESILKGQKTIGIIAEGNGDYVSMELENGCISFENHNWDTFNYYPMCSGFKKFFNQWSLISFQSGKSLSWASVLGIDGVDWNSEDYNEKFKRKKFIF